MAAQPKRSPASSGIRRSRTRRRAARLKRRATTWAKYQAEPTLATNQRTVPKPKVAVSQIRARGGRSRRPRTSQARPTVTPPRTALTSCWWIWVPKRATTGRRTTAGIGG